MEIKASSFKLRANAPKGQKRFPISKSDFLSAQLWFFVGTHGNSKNRKGNSSQESSSAPLITARIAPPKSNTGTPISVMPTTWELAEWSKPCSRIFSKCVRTLFSPPVKTTRHGSQESVWKRSPARSASRPADDSTKQVHRLKHQAEADHYLNQARTNGWTRDTTVQTRMPPAE